MLDDAIAKAKNANFDHMLDLQIAMAKKLREQLARIEKLRHQVLSMEQKTIAEIKSFSSPPDGVFQTMQAAFLLLGHTKKEVKVTIVMKFYLTERPLLPYKKFWG